MNKKKITLILAILFFLIQTFLAKNQPSEPQKTVISPTPIATSSAVMGVQDNQLYIVKNVIDGDTLELESGAKVRLIGINTPETRDPRTGVQCFGKEASAIAKERLEGKHIYLESDPSQSNVDKYGRLLRYVFLADSTHFNLYMIEEGFAYEYTYDTPYKYQTEFKQAQMDAQKNKKGLWAENTCDGKKIVY